MRRQTSVVASALIAGLLLPLSSGAQARVIFTVFEAMGGGSTFPSNGAAVCLSSNTNTRFTSGGQVTFEGVTVGTWAAFIWKSGFKPKSVNVTVPVGALAIPVVVTLSERSSDSPPCVVPRLGEEKFPVRGKEPLTTDGGRRTLDCHQFSQSHVMVGITGRHGDAVNRIRLVCARMQSGGTLSSVLQFSDEWHIEDNNGTSFGRHCPSGQIVSAMQVTVHPQSGQIRSATIQCRKVGTNGLSTGTSLTLAPIGIPTTKSMPTDTCNGGRPARAIRAGADAFTPTLSHLLFSTWIIASTQFICEQPVVP